MMKAAWHPYMDIDEDDELDDVKFDIDRCVRFGDGAPVTELNLYGKSLLLRTTEDENAIDDAASALAADFIHDFTYSTRQ